MKYELNQRARQLLERVAASTAEFRVRETNVQDARIFDFGIRTEGGLDAGQALAEICMAGLGWASILPGDMRRRDLAARLRHHRSSDGGLPLQPVRRLADQHGRLFRDGFGSHAGRLRA